MHGRGNISLADRSINMHVCDLKPSNTAIDVIELATKPKRPTNDCSDPVVMCFLLAGPASITILCNSLDADASPNAKASKNSALLSLRASAFRRSTLDQR